MAKYILKRLLVMILTIFIVMVITFILMQFMPGSPFSNPKLTKSQIELLNQQYGLNKPIWQQFVQYIWNAFHFDFGTSYVNTGQSVTSIIAQRLPVSLFIGFQALIVAVPLGMFVGTIQGVKRNTRTDYSLSFITIFFIALPDFLFAMVLLLLLAVKYPIFPINGFDGWTSSILPSIALAAAIVGYIARFTRSQTIETLNSDQIQLAFAKGLDKSEVVEHHVVRNSLIPVLTIIGPVFANFLTGSVLVEKIFGIPGIGQQFLTSVTSKDFPVIMGTTILYTVILQVMILITDIITALVDPRIRLGGKS